MRKLLQIQYWLHNREDLRLIGKSTIENKIDFQQYHLLQKKKSKEISNFLIKIKLQPEMIIYAWDV